MNHINNHDENIDKKREKKKRQKGFTLVELLVVLAILVAIEGIVAPQVIDRLSKAEPLMRRALEISKERLGVEHPRTRWTEENLDGLLQEMDEQDSHS